MGGKRKNNPMLTIEEFSRFHQLMEDKLFRFVLTPYGRTKCILKTVEELANHSSTALFAVNRQARISVATALNDQLKEFQNRSKRYFFVTLTSFDFTFSLKKSLIFHPSKLVDWAKFCLNGLDYIGAVDLAYYPDCTLLNSKHKSMISWHVHAIVWVDKDQDLEDVLRIINEETIPFIPGAVAAHRRPLRTDKLDRHAYYMLKAPWSRYNIFPASTQKSTGTGRKFHQQCDRLDLRPGAAAAMAHILTGLTLPELMFAGGSGRLVLCVTNKNARQSVEEFKYHEHMRVREILGLSVLNNRIACPSECAPYSI